MGERVRLRSSIDKSVLYPTPITYNSQARAGARINLTLDEYADIVQHYVEKYPDLSQNPLKKNHLNKIMHDFPDIKTEAQIREKSDIIVQFYNGLLKVEVLPIIEKASKAKAGGRVASSPFGQLNPLEEQHLANNLSMVTRYRYASLKAISEREARYGVDLDSDGKRSNSFQHAVWNCLIIREALYQGYSKTNAILFTRNITSDHECDMSGNRQYTEHTAMDLHNNLSARSFMGNHTSPSVWPFAINCPSEADIFNAWYNASFNQSYHVCSPIASLIPLYSWEFLYGTDRANLGDKLYFFLPLPGGC